MGTLSSHITKKFVTRYRTSLVNSSPIPVYMENLSFNRSAEYQRRRQVRGGADWIQEVTSLSKAYGKSRLIPSSTSYLEMLTHIPTGMIQLISSWLFGIRKISISTVNTSKINGDFFSVFLSVSGMLGKEALVILSNLSRRMAENSRNKFHTYVYGSMAILQ